MREKISNLPDKELLHRYTVLGQTDCFGELYNRYMPLLYGVALKYFGDAAQAEDAVIDLFESLFQKIADYEINVFRTWLYAVMKNHCLQALRKEKDINIMPLSPEIMESDEILHLFDDADADEQRYEALQGCMEKLPDVQRVAVSEFFIQEKSYRDIADATGWALKSVKSYIQNGKRNLKICIEKKVK